MTYRDERQVALDVARVPGLNKASRRDLERRIAHVLTPTPELHYYQGFHEVALHSTSAKQLSTLSIQVLRDFMASSMDATLAICRLVPELVAAYDQSLKPVMTMVPPYFAVAPLLTLFAHHSDDNVIVTEVISDVLKSGLAHEVYLLAALILLHRDQLVVDDPDEAQAMLQKIGASLTRANYEETRILARRLRLRHPLSRLHAWKQISPYSVLKTGRQSREKALRALASLENPSNHRLLRLAAAVGIVALGYLITRRYPNSSRL